MVFGASKVEFRYYYDSFEGFTEFYCEAEVGRTGHMHDTPDVSIHAQSATQCNWPKKTRIPA